MVRISTVWDQTVAVLSGRGGTLFGIALLTMVLPPVIRAVLVYFAGAAGVVAGVTGLIVGLAVLVASIWGQLSIIAMASDPAVGRAEGLAHGRARILPAIGVTLVAVVALFVVAIPIVGALASSSIDIALLAAGNPAGLTMSAGTQAFVSIYTLVLAIVGVFVCARLFPLNAVVLHERLGLAAFARSWSLTRGMTWRVVGVLILFLIVFGIAMMAAQLVTGLVARLILGGDAVPTIALITGIAANVVAAGFSVVSLTFVAQLYSALTGQQRAA